MAGFPHVKGSPAAMPTGNLKSGNVGQKSGGKRTLGSNKGLTGTQMKTPLGRKFGKR